MHKTKITIFDMQPITPQTGGGRIRLAGLYHNLGKELDVTYIGSYDWKGESFRDQQSYENLREICIPLSDKHFEQNERLSQQAGFNAIDMLFNKLGFMSNNYLQAVRQFAYESDILIFSHPWVFPLVEDMIDYSRQMVIYDAQNLEGLLRYELYQDMNNNTAKMVIENVAKIEYELSKKCDAILTCSENDMIYFKDIYEIESEKLKFIPNGVFFDEINGSLKPESDLKKTKKALFMGSSYGPNIEAVEFIVHTLAKQVEGIEFIIAGGVCSEFEDIDQKNVTLLGRFSEEEKGSILKGVDLAINPMFSGSGTNIKMFDFMAANLPIISTPTGARGIIEESISGIVVANKEEFATAIKEFDLNQNYHTELIAKNNFAFENISTNLGYYLKSLEADTKENIFFFSTWNIFCGIADHTRQLANELYQNNHVSILGNDHQDLYASNIVEDLKFSNIFKVWHYDDKHYQDSTIDIDTIVELVKDKRSLFVLHYHYAFFSSELLIQLISRVSPHCSTFVLTLHNINMPDDKVLNYLKENRQIKVVVHNDKDAVHLNRYDINALTFFLGVPRLNQKRKEKENASDSFKIGGFGFLRKHKGIFNCVKAIGSMHQKNIEYLGLHALLDTNESHGLLKKCTNYIKENAIEERIKINTAFLPIHEIMEELSSCDMILLPYDESNEGLSASASLAFAIGIPVGVTDTHIFDSIKSYAYIIENNTEDAIEYAINELINDRALYEKYVKKALEYNTHYSIGKTAENYIDLESLKKV